MFEQYRSVFQQLVERIVSFLVNCPTILRFGSLSLGTVFSSLHMVVELEFNKGKSMCIFGL